jgi:NAD(P)-dependent dehydrogenase (short-subunit alcohol dehydrogenase family)
MARLAGKVAFITGGAGGIGRATAERFAEEGAAVVVADIDAASGEAAAASARAQGAGRGGDAHFLHCDVTERASVEAAIAQTVARYGKLHILHNNAGGSTMQDGPVTEAPEEEFWRAIKLDLYGTFLCCKIGIPEIVKAGGGSVINMASNVALMALPGRDCYTAAKGGVASLTRWPATRASRNWRRPTCWASASRSTSPTWPSTSPPTRPRSPRARSSASTAASRSTDEPGRQSA